MPPPLAAARLACYTLPTMPKPADSTARVIAQGRALVRAIEAIGTIDTTGWFERLNAGLLLAAYKRRLRAVVAVAPAWVVEEILSASERAGEERKRVWMSEN